MRILYLKKNKRSSLNRWNFKVFDDFAINVSAYDLIIGYRADDSYFDYAEAFLNNTITVEQLALAMQLGRLGEQIVIKSKNAFSRLKFDGFSPAEKDKY